MGLRETLDRPECWDFAMEFLGCPENEQVVAYVEQLEAALAQQPNHSGDADEMVQPAAVVELTDDEIESVAHRSCSIYVHGRDQIYHRYEFGRLTIFDFATKLIQTYRAKQGGAA